MYHILLALELDLIKKKFVTIKWWCKYIFYPFASQTIRVHW